MSRKYRSDDFGRQRYVPGEEHYNMQLLINELRAEVHERDHAIQKVTEIIQSKDEEIQRLREEIERIRNADLRRDDPPPFTPIMVDE
jgi:hypothetical protein